MKRIRLFLVFLTCGLILWLLQMLLVPKRHPLAGVRDFFLHPGQRPADYLAVLLPAGRNLPL